MHTIHADHPGLSGLSSLFIPTTVLAIFPASTFHVTSAWFQHSAITLGACKTIEASSALGTPFKLLFHHDRPRSVSIETWGPEVLFHLFLDLLLDQQPKIVRLHSCVLWVSKLHFSFGTSLLFDLHAISRFFLCWAWTLCLHFLRYVAANQAATLGTWCRGFHGSGMRRRGTIQVPRSTTRAMPGVLGKLSRKWQDAQDASNFNTWPSQFITIPHIQSSPVSWPNNNLGSLFAHIAHPVAQLSKCLFFAILRKLNSIHRHYQQTQLCMDGCSRSSGSRWVEYRKHNGIWLALFFTNTWWR